MGGWSDFLLSTLLPQPENREAERFHAATEYFLIMINYIPDHHWSQH